MIILNNISNYSKLQRNSLQSTATNFCGNLSSIQDTFENKSDIKRFKMNVYNPNSFDNFFDYVTVNLKKPQIIKLTQHSRNNKKNEPLILDYNPNRYGFLKDKNTNEPIKTPILISQKGKKTSYHFMSEDLEKEYGYINISDNFLNLSILKLMMGFVELYENYPELGITGPRIVVEYLENFDDKNIGGVGALADKISVLHCLKRKIKPVIVSMADKDSHVAHYLRGKRFLPIESDTPKFNYYMDMYGTADVNEIVKELINNNKNSERISTDDWSMVPMYMPQNKIDEIIKELKDSNTLL